MGRAHKSQPGRINGDTYLLAQLPLQRFIRHFTSVDMPARQTKPRITPMPHQQGAFAVTAIQRHFYANFVSIIHYLQYIRFAMIRQCIRATVEI